MQVLIPDGYRKALVCHECETDKWTFYVSTDYGAGHALFVYRDMKGAPERCTQNYEGAEELQGRVEDLEHDVIQMRSERDRAIGGRDVAIEECDKLRSVVDVLKMLAPATKIEAGVTYAWMPVRMGEGACDG